MKKSLLFLTFLLLFQACDNVSEVYRHGDVELRDDDGSLKSTENEVTITEAWVKNYGSADGMAIADSTMDSTGNIYTTGGNFLNNIGDLFIVKYDNNGTRLWSKVYDYGQSEEGKAITVDKEGNLYVTGLTGDSHHGQISNILLLKVDSNGEELWHQSYGSDSEDDIFDIAIDSQNDIYICGTTKGDLDGTTLIKFTDSFITKYSTDGNRLWTKNFGQNYSDYAKNLFIDIDDLLYVSGSISGVGDIYLTKYNTDGTQVWYKTYPTNNFEYAANISLGKDDNFYISGKVGLRDENKEYIEPNTDEVFARKVDKEGKEKYYITFGTQAQNEIAYSITGDKYGHAYLLGTSRGSFTDSSLKEMASPFLTHINPNGIIKSTKEYSGSIINHANIHVTDNNFLFIASWGNLSYDDNSPSSNAGFLLKLALDYE